MKIINDVNYLNKKIPNYILSDCDCCNVIIGYSDFTIFNEHDTQLFICEDCNK